MAPSRMDFPVGLGRVTLVITLDEWGPRWDGRRRGSDAGNMMGSGWRSSRFTGRHRLDRGVRLRSDLCPTPGHGISEGRDAVIDL